MFLSCFGAKTGSTAEPYIRVYQNTQCFYLCSFRWIIKIGLDYQSQPAKLDLNKKSLPKQKTIQNFTIDAQGFRKTKNENPPTWEMGVTS